VPVSQLPAGDSTSIAGWQSSVHLCHSARGPPSRPPLRSDLMMRQRLTEPASAPGDRAGGPEKWHKVAHFAAFFRASVQCNIRESMRGATSVVGRLLSTIVPASVRSLSGGKADCSYCTSFGPSADGIAAQIPTDIQEIQGLTMRKEAQCFFEGVGGGVAVSPLSAGALGFRSPPGDRAFRPTGQSFASHHCRVGETHQCKALAVLVIGGSTHPTKSASAPSRHALTDPNHAAPRIFAASLHLRVHLTTPRPPPGRPRSPHR
jgi:hypothetical protein